MKSIGIVVAGIVAGLLLAGGPAWATEYYWTNSAGGTYGAAGNWNPSGPPSSSDNANFTNNATYTVTWGASASAANAAFSAPGGAVTLDTTANCAWTLSGGLTLANTMTLSPNRGTLNTAGDSTLNYLTDFTIGGASGNTFTWNITGGTTKFLSDGAASESANVLHVGQSGRGILNISGASTVVTNNNWLHIGRYADQYCELNITNGGKLYTGGQTYIGWESLYNKALVSGTGSVWTIPAVSVGKGGSGRYNTLVVTNGGSLVGSITAGVEGSSNQVIITGPGSSVTGTACNVGLWYGATGNNLTVEKGATAWFAGNAVNTFFGRDASGVDPATQSNSILVTGAGSTFTVTSSWAYVGGSNTSFRVRDGGSAYIGWFPGDGSVGGVGTVFEVADTGSVLSVYEWVAHNVSLIVTNGGSFVSRVRYFKLGQSSGSAASVLVRDPGSTLSVTGTPFLVGEGANSTGSITVENGGRFEYTNPNSDTWGMPIGYGAGSTGSIVVAGAGSVFGANFLTFGRIYVVGSGSRLVVTNQATFWTYSREGLTVGWDASRTNNTVLVADGGLLDFRRNPDSQAYISVINQAGNVVSNIGGIFQFVHANPIVDPGAFGKVVINGGTVSFRDIADATVLCNQSGTGMDSAERVQWLGANGFRLNSASNTTANQAYTFTTNNGAANFARLDLFNGSLYRGGAVTIGSGGTLTVTGAVSTIATNLTIQSGGAYRVTLDAGGTMSRVAVTNGTVTLGGTLAIELASAPQPGVLYTVLDNQGANPVSGSFGAIAEATYGGRSYAFLVRTTGGTGNDVVAGLARGTVISIF
jgi:T5SS/PEP-CTERM-associated repeat protein